MQQVGEGVDHRDGAHVRELLDLRVIKRPHHESVHEARQHPGGVGDAFAAPQLDVVPIQEKRIAPEFVDADLERHARARRRLRKYHRPRLAGQRGRVPAALRLELARQAKQPAQFGRLKVGLLEEMLHENGHL